MSKIDIGVASYGNDVARLARALQSIEQNSVMDWRCFILHNPSSGDEAVREFLNHQSNPRFLPIFMNSNEGYAGAINAFWRRSDAEFFAYCDNDIEIMTHRWDALLCEVLQRNKECGQVFPGSGHYGFDNGRYHECLWNAGYCWVMRSSTFLDLSVSDARHNRCHGNAFPIDTLLGHHEEVDLMIRLRLAGYQIGCRPDVSVLHHETATKANPADHQPGGRIHDGVVRWMNKWNGYFCGNQLKYSMTEYDPRALRYTDWPPCALYLERRTLALFPDWNNNPRVVDVPEAGQMDAIEVLKPLNCYRGRAI